MRQILRRGIVIAMVVALAPAPAAAALEESAPPSDAPVLATDDAYEVTEDHVLEVLEPGLLGNDNPAPGTCVASVDETGLVGTIEVGAGGAFVYTPPLNFNGETSFAYGIRDAGGESCAGPASSEATVTITVAPDNDPPTATADSFFALKDRTLNVGVPGVLINDGDIDSGSITAVLDATTAHGILILAANGSFSYTPAAGYTGPDVFSYHAFDGALSSPIRVVSLTVTAIPPVATPTPIPTPTLPPDVTPEPTPTEPLPSSSIDPAATPGPFATPQLTAIPSGAASSAPSLAPGETPGPTAPAAGGGLSLPVLLVLVLFALLVGFGAALYLPKWLKARNVELFRDDEP